jgi:hypothetical protein
VEKIIDSPTERPIVFRAENVLAIIAGRKTQARRLVDLRLEILALGKVNGTEALDLCRYGRPGERLWVRETIKREGDGRWRYAADNRPVRQRKFEGAPAGTTILPDGVSGAEYPASYMPRWAVRLVLEITDVRLQRLHDITLADAIAEGPPCWSCDGPIDGVGKKDCVCYGNTNAARPSFVMLWERSHSETEPWASNPWVWAITFRKIDRSRQSLRRTA